MRKTISLLRRTAFALAICFPNLAYCSPIYTMRFFNVDDQMDGFISNNTHSESLFLSCNFGADCGVFDFTSFVTPGLNTLTIQDYNGPSTGPVGPVSGNAGYTYGFDFQINGVTYDSVSCGTFNTFGCDNNSYQTGLVYSHTIQFVAQSEVPEPPTLALIAIGLAGYGRLRKKRS